MSTNRVKTINENQAQTMLDMEQQKPKWVHLVSDAIKNENWKSKTCHAYSIKDRTTTNQTEPCLCGRLPRAHSFDGTPNKDLLKSKKFNRQKFLVQKELTVYGQISNGAKFIRWNVDTTTRFQTLSKIIKENVGSKPHLLISCFGGAENFVMTDTLEKEFMIGIAQAAVTEHVWLLTTGLNSGVSKLIGQYVHRYRLLNKSSIVPTLIGMTGWGTVSKNTREVLAKAAYKLCYNMYASLNESSDLGILDYDENKTLDRNHSHFILLDDGSIGDFIDDAPRADFVDDVRHMLECQSITIIVEGGLNTIQVIQNDLKKGQPVIVIHRSGRIANVIGTLLESLGVEALPTESDVIKLLDQFCYKQWLGYDENASNINEAEIRKRKKDKSDIVAGIIRLFRSDYRKYLSLFDLERDSSLTDSIFKAVDSVQSASSQQEESFLELAINWNYAIRAEAMSKSLAYDQKLYSRLFEQALMKNRPTLIDYFLRRNHNPFLTDAFNKLSENGRHIVDTSDPLENRTSTNQTGPQNQVQFEESIQVKCAIKFILENLYRPLDSKKFDDYTAPTTLEELDANHSRLIGPYTDSFYFAERKNSQLARNFKLLSSRCWTCEDNNMPPPNRAVETVCTKPFGTQEMLRELFLWSVYAGYKDMAFILLLQIESRMIAALIAACIAQRLSRAADTLDVQHRYKEYAKEYEAYATECAKKCYEHNERLACQLMLRENQIFGNMTCMQVAISSRITTFVNTNCFNEVLQRQWFGQLPRSTSESLSSKVKFIASLVTLGLIPHKLRKYRKEDEVIHTSQKNVKKQENTPRGIYDRWKGVKEHTIESPNFFQKLYYFHSTPAVKMFYHFVS
ncbi:unnamed protein product [Adineta ricciae]|uniref:TRPM SLOG domain-containing protein n=1 Tax=Adineta ricciae TaxID=249248 RepID=A0A815SIG4_ADIRI|nr:unnamed protein product [Adineta ricciae]